MDAQLPAALSIGAVLTFFVAVLFLLHVVLIWVKPLTLIGWKAVDYIWVSLSILGVIASIHGVRQDVARNMADSYAQGAKAYTVLVGNSLQSGTFCRPYTRTAASPAEPEFSRLVKEDAEICAWFSKAKSRYEALVKGGLPITMESLGGPVPGDPGDYRTQNLETYLVWLNEAQANEQTLRQESVAKDWEGWLRLAGPWILAAAIALRLTKVTGEIRGQRNRPAKA